MQYSKDVYGPDRREHATLRRILLWSMLMLLLFFILLSAALFYKVKVLDAKLATLTPQPTAPEQVQIVDKNAPSKEELASLRQRYERDPKSLKKMRAYAHGAFASYLQYPSEALRTSARELFEQIVDRLAEDSKQPLSGEWLALARLSYDAKNYSDSQKWALQVLNLDPQQAEGLLLLGLSSWRLGDLRGAIGAFDRYRLATDDPWGAYIIGILTDLQNKDASASFERARLAHFSPELQRDIAVRMILNYLGQNNLVKAQEEAQSFVAKYPARAEAYYLMGMVRSAQGKLAEARAYWRKAINQDQNFGPAIAALKASRN